MKSHSFEGVRIMNGCEMACGPKSRSMDEASLGNVVDSHQSDSFCFEVRQNSVYQAHSLACHNQQVHSEKSSGHVHGSFRPVASNLA